MIKRDKLEKTGLQNALSNSKDTFFYKLPDQRFTVIAANVDQNKTKKQIKPLNVNTVEYISIA